MFVESQLLPLLHQEQDNFKKRHDDIFSHLKSILNADQGIQSREELDRILQSFQISLAGASPENQAKLSVNDKYIIALTQAFSCAVNDINKAGNPCYFDEPINDLSTFYNHFIVREDKNIFPTDLGLVDNHLFRLKCGKINEQGMH